MTTMLPPLSVHELIRCLQRFQCIACGDATGLDPETGFAFHLCPKCEKTVRLARKDVAAAKRFYAKHRADAAANLDRLTTDGKVGQRVDGIGSPAPSSQGARAARARKPAKSGAKRKRAKLTVKLKPRPKRNRPLAPRSRQASK